MGKVLSSLLAACLLVYPFAAVADDYGSQPSQTQHVPPVAQPLVREGDFAIRLAAELDLGSPETEAEAEAVLVEAGVAPLNGWIADYPVTPEIIGQLQDAVVEAANDDKIPMTADQAVRGLAYLTSQMDLPAPAAPGTTTAAGGDEASSPQPAPTAGDDWYYDYYDNPGPPIITYYPPPPDFLYLYVWVPFPAFWFGVQFPGYYICRNFTTTVIVTDHDFIRRREIVTNRVIDRNRFAVVDPVIRTGQGPVRPVTTLRAEDGRRFRTFRDFRRDREEVRTAGRSSGLRGRTEQRYGGFRSSAARRSAAAIYSRSRENVIRRGAAQGRGPAMTSRGFSSQSRSGLNGRPSVRYQGTGLMRRMPNATVRHDGTSSQRDEYRYSGPVRYGRPGSRVIPWHQNPVPRQFNRRPLGVQRFTVPRAAIGTPGRSVVRSGRSVMHRSSPLGWNRR